MKTTLVIFTKSGRRKEIPLRPGVTIIGRRPDCDIRIPTAFVSRKHTRIVCQEEETLVQDLGSSNGTYVNREQVTEATVNAGDTIVVGTSVFTVQIDGQPANINPPAQPSAEMHDSAAIVGSGQSATLTAQPEDFIVPVAPENNIDPLADMEPLADSSPLDDSKA